MYEKTSEDVLREKILALANEIDIISGSVIGRDLKWLLKPISDKLKDL